MEQVGQSYIQMLVFSALIILIIAEAVTSKLRGRPVYSLADSGVSLFMTILNTVIIPTSFAMISAILYNHRIFTISDIWLSALLLFIVQDFLYYWYHRASHWFRLAWASHAVHHSSPYFNIMTAWRLESFGGPFASWIYWAPLALMGFPPSMVATIYFGKTIYANLCHTQMIRKLPRWYEYIFNTPSHHRVHHGSNDCYIDRNFGSTLIIWDRLFGTFVEERPSEPLVYGLKKPINTNNVLVILFHEWISLGKDLMEPSTFTRKLKVIFLVNR